MLDTLHTRLPQQKLPRREKDEAWQKACVDALITLSDFDRALSPSRDLIHKLYGYYNGEIDPEDYAYVLKPYGETRRNYPAKLQNFPLIKPIVDLLMGEKRKRPINPVVVATNSDVVTEREEEFMRRMEENLQQHFVNELAQLGVDVPPGEIDPEVPSPDEVAEEFELSYKDRRAINGQHALDYIIYSEQIRRKLLKAWKHWLIAGRVVTRRGYLGGNLNYEVLDPKRVDYAKSPDVDFIEDAMWATVYEPMTVSDVIDRFHDVLTDEEIDQIENPHKMGSTQSLPEITSGTSKTRMVEVVYCEWKSMKKIFFVTYTDEYGQLLERIEEEDYTQLEEDLHAEPAWVTEVWEGYRIDGNIYKNVRPQRHLRGDLDNPSETKLSINGRTYSDLNASPISLVLLGVPYQLKYNIYHFRLENAIAKAKDVISVFDLNMIPAGWSPEKWMYYMDAMGIAWVDYNKEGVRVNPQHQTILDMTIKVIEDYVTLLESIRQEWEWVSGVNRHRQGQISQYDGKGVTEQSIAQSSHITEDLFGLFAELEQSDFQALLDLSKYVWIEGKYAPYLTEDMRQMWLSLDGIEHMESEYGVFVSDSAKDREKQALIEQLGQAMLQNGTSISTVIDIIDSTSFPQIKEKVQRAEASAARLQQRMQEMEQQAAEAERQIKIEEMNREDENKERDRQNKIEIALIQAESRNTPEESNDSASEAERMKDRREGEKIEVQREAIRSKERIEHAKRALESANAKRDAALKEKEIIMKKQQSQKQNRPS